MKRLKRIVAIVTVLLIVFSCGLFSFSASAASETYSFKLSNLSYNPVLLSLNNEVTPTQQAWTNGYCMFYVANTPTAGGYINLNFDSPVFYFIEGQSYSFSFKVGIQRKFMQFFHADIWLQDVSNSWQTFTDIAFFGADSVPEGNISDPEGYNWVYLNFSFIAPSDLKLQRLLIKFTSSNSGLYEVGLVDEFSIKYNDNLQGAVDDILGADVPGSGDYDSGSVDAGSALDDYENQVNGIFDSIGTPDYDSFFSLDLVGLVPAFSGLQQAFSTIFGSFGIFGVVFEFAVIVGAVALLLGVVVSMASRYSNSHVSRSRSSKRSGGG